MAASGTMLPLSRHAVKYIGKVAARLLRLRHRQRRARPAPLIDVAAAIEVGLREDLGFGRTLARLGIDEDYFHARLGRLPAQRSREFEVHGKQYRMQHDGRPERHRKHAIVASGDPTQIHVHSYFSLTSLS